MVDRPEDTESSPELGRARRAPPTIDLEASEVSDESRNTAADAPPEPVSEEPAAAISSRVISSWVVAAVSGAVAASLVICVGWILGWPPVLPAAPAAPQVDAAAIDGLAARIAGVESKTNAPAAAAPDPAMAGRMDALEKSMTALRGELASARMQSEKLAAAINDVKAPPAAAAAPPADLSGLDARMAQLESATRTQTAEIAQGSARPADDLPLRRVVAASLLDVSVRQGDPYAAALAAAKSLAADADSLKPLDGFAASGLPSANALSRELLMLVPKLSPPVQENATTGTGIVDRLQAGAAKLVRIQRTDAVGNDRGNVVARITAAALRNDSAEARRELNTLSAADRAAAQSWIDKSDARDAALAASRQFAADAMAALAKPAP